MALPSRYDSYHDSMMQKIRGVSNPQVSDGAAALIAAISPGSAPAQSRLSGIKIPDGAQVAESMRPKTAPLISFPTGGITNAGRGVTPNGGGSSNLGATSPRTGAAPSSGLEGFLAKIAKKESGGNYNAVNKDSGALGKYQVMPANVPSWTKQALGKSLTPQQFLKDTAAQEAVAKTILGGYLNKYGEQGASIAWYSGESNAKKFAKTGQVSTKSQGKYPSIAAYAAAIAGK